MGPLASLLRRFILVIVFVSTPSLVRASSEEPPAAPAPVPPAPEHPRYRLEPIVITADRVPIPLDRIPADVTVIAPERLESRRPLMIADALRWVPGIDVERSGSTGKLTDVRLRGADPRHTLVLFDGIPLNGPWLGIFDFAELMDPGVDRIEVLGGPASSLYGSGAVGGVIQVLSPGATEEGIDAGRPAGRGRLRANAEYGENVTLRQGIQWNGTVGRAPLGIAATRLSSDGVGPRDGYTGLNGNFHAELPVGTLDRVRVSGLATSGKKELPYDFFFDFSDPTLSPFGSNKQIRDPNNDEEDRLFAGIATWRHALRPSHKHTGKGRGASSPTRAFASTTTRATDPTGSRGSRWGSSCRRRGSGS